MPEGAEFRIAEAGSGTLGPGHRVADRLADRLDDAGHPNMTALGFDIDPDDRTDPVA